MKTGPVNHWRGHKETFTARRLHLQFENPVRLNENKCRAARWNPTLWHWYIIHTGRCQKVSPEHRNRCKYSDATSRASSASSTDSSVITPHSSQLNKYRQGAVNWNECVHVPMISSYFFPHCFELTSQTARNTHPVFMCHFLCCYVTTCTVYPVFNPFYHIV